MNVGPNTPRLISGQEFYSLMKSALTIMEELLSKTAKTRQQRIQQMRCRILHNSLQLKMACNVVQKLLSSRLLSKNLKIKIYRTIILPVVLYGCEIWSLTLREERRLRVFENGVLRRIFGPKGDEVTGEWRKLHNEELKGLYSSPNTYSAGDKI